MSRLLTLAVMILCVSVAFADEQGRQTAETVNTVYEGVSTPPAPALRAPVTPPSTEAILYDQSDLITHPGGGFGGADVSVLQDGTLGLTIYGFGHQGGTINNWVADDFTVTDDSWTVDSLCFFGYQSFAGVPSTIVSVNWQIWDGDPSIGGSSIVCSDSATLANGRLTTSWSGMYRTLESNIATNTDRAIMYNVAEVSPACVLPGGTYWVVWQSEGSAAFSGPWCPPVTMLGVSSTGNGKQNQDGLWVDLVDGVEPQGVPFQVKGTVGGGDPCDICDATTFQAKCVDEGGGTWNIKFRLVAFETVIKGCPDVVFDVNGTEYVRPWQTNGTHSRALNQLFGQPAGVYTVSLLAPADCHDPIVLSCGVDGVPSGEWEDLDLGFGEDTPENMALTTVPVETELLGNYPNPFNPSTTIIYALANEGFVSLKIYNTLGQEVATLVNEFQAAGTFEATWNGTNDFGAAVSSGIYLYRLQTNDVVFTEKMMFMK